jgi:hypothetical protein
MGKQRQPACKFAMISNLGDPDHDYYLIMCWITHTQPWSCARGPRRRSISARRGRQKILVTIPLGRFPYASVQLPLAMSVSQAAEGEEAFTLVGSVK